MTHRLMAGLTVAALMLALAFTLRFATAAGLVDAEAARRILQVVIGLGLASYANLMPKQLGPMKRSPLAQARIQAALRVGGWSLSLAGLAYAGLWAFAPLGTADDLATLVVAAATVTTMAYAAWTYAACRAARLES